MNRRKFRRHRARLFSLALVAFVLNLTFPNTRPVHAQAISSPSHAVIPSNMAPAEPSVTNLPQLPSVPDKPPKAKIVVRASAYTSSRWETDSDPFTTASGTKVHEGTLATNGLPFGAKIRIPEYYGSKVFTVEDRMNTKWGNRRVDIWMTNRDAAKQWGVRTVTIEIL